MRFSLRICRFLGSYGSRDAAGLVPVPLGSSFFLYALGDMHIALAHMCVRTYWDMWDHWDHPYESTCCWSQSSSSVPLSTGAARR
jgi:hypothetical protein